VVELEPGGFRLREPDGRAHALSCSVRCSLTDAASSRRFVRLLRLDGPGVAFAIVTPPEEGAIAPRAARLPLAPEDAAVVDDDAFDALHDWIASRGRLGGRTVDELARLAPLASVALAVTIGEVAGQVARELGWGGSGPMRGSGLVARALLRPLELAARDSERAHDALTAALAQWPLADAG
jgi:hypothetical protein